MAPLPRALRFVPAEPPSSGLRPATELVVHYLLLLRCALQCDFFLVLLAPGFVQKVLKLCSLRAKFGIKLLHPVVSL